MVTIQASLFKYRTDNDMSNLFAISFNPVQQDQF